VDDIHARRENFPGGFGVMPEAAGGFSPLAMTKGRAGVPAAVLGAVPQPARPARLSHDVADEENFHGTF